MGYYTDYSITFTLNGEKSGAVCDALEDMNILDGINECGDTVYADAHGDWSYWEEDLCEVSVKFPAMFIEVEASGEQCGDLLCAYIQNGASQRCVGRIIYDDYDPEKMRQIVQPLEPDFEAPVADLI